MITVKEISPPIKVSGLSSLMVFFDYKPEIVDALKAEETYYFHKKSLS